MSHISIIMPAYNVEAYIGKAIESIIAQTYTDWELVIYNDASNDDTLSVAQSYAEKDLRIRVLSGGVNLGCGHMARMEALRNSAGTWIAPLDADDYVEPNYLQELIADRDKEQAQIVYPTMWHSDGSRLVPTKYFDYHTRSGRDAMALTLVRWTIGTNGGLIWRQLYPPFSEIDSFPSRYCVYSDEVFDRFVMFKAQRVAFSHAKYFYRYNPTSITQKVSFRFFDFLETDGVLVEFIRKHYEHKDNTRIQAEVHRYTRLIEALMLLTKVRLKNNDERNRIWKYIHATYSDIKWDIVSKRTGWKMRILMRLNPSVLYYAFKVMMIVAHK